MLPSDYIYQKLRFLLLIKFREDVRENLQASPQNAVHMGDCRAVVGHRDACVLCAFRAVHDLAVVKHARAAVDDHLVFRQILCERQSGCGVYLYDRARVLAEPLGELICSDVLALSVMCAAF